MHLKTVKPTIIMIMEKPCFSVFDVRVRTVMTGHDWLTWDDTGGCHRQAGDSTLDCHGAIVPGVVAASDTCGGEPALRMLQGTQTNRHKFNKAFWWIFRF